MTLANSLTRRNERALNIAEAETPPVSVARSLQVISFLLLLLEAQRARIARLEVFDRQKAVEIDRLRRAERRVAA